MRSFLLASFVSVVSAGAILSQTSTPIQTPSSAGKQIQDAARASVEDRNPSQDQRTGNIQILTDTQGVDFGPYLQRVISDIRTNWYKLIPEQAKNEKGNVAIELAILKTGEVAGMRLVTVSGDVALDRAAWSSIVSANPFPPLPTEFTGPSLFLRFRFFYNPTSADLAGVKSSQKAEPANFPTTHARLIKPLGHRDLPKYPKAAIKKKIEGTVRLRALVDANGVVTGFPKVDGDELLVTASIRAISKWQFHSAQENGSAVEEEVPIEIDFRADRKIVQARVTWSDSEPQMDMQKAGPR